MGEESSKIVASAAELGGETSEGQSMELNLEEDLLDALKEAGVPEPAKYLNHKLIDPEIQLKEHSCERNYSVECPIDFVLIENFNNTGYKYCLPKDTYKGSCIEFNISRMTKEEKKMKATLCSTLYPCINCIRNYSTQCPKLWVPLGESITACIPTREYEGNCGVTDFDMHNITMLTQWSYQCKAYYPCATANQISREQSNLNKKT